jgi:hypothetical protein
MYQSWIMHHDYANWLQENRASRSVREQVVRATTVPRLFSMAEVTDLDRAMRSRGLSRAGGSLCHRDREAWTQLEEGVTLISDSLAWDNSFGRRYYVCISRKPYESQRWVLASRRGLGGKPLAEGSTLDGLWEAMDQREILRAD